jgi:hypothetical protein
VIDVVGGATATTFGSVVAVVSTRLRVTNGAGAAVADVVGAEVI